MCASEHQTEVKPKETFCQAEMAGKEYVVLGSRELITIHQGNDRGPTIGMASARFRMPLPILKVWSVFLLRLRHEQA